MKSSALLFASLLGKGIANGEEHLEKRQMGMFGGSFNGPATPGKVVRTLKPEFGAGSKREFKIWGPYKLPPSNGVHAKPGFAAGGPKLDPNSDSINSVISPPCSNCTILKAIANLAYADGSPADVANGVYTHHIIMSQSGRMQLMMPISPPSCGFAALLSALSKGSKGKGKSSGNMGSIMGAPTRPSRVAVQKRQLGGLFGKGKNVDLSRASAVFIGGGGSAGSGSAFAAKNSDVKSGVYIGPNDKFTFTAEIVNYDPKEKPIYLSLDYEWVPGKTAGLMDVGMGALNANGCGDLNGLFMPPKDKPITYEGAEWTVTQPGYFVNFTPHLHDGGVNVKIILNGKEVCEAKAVYGSAEGTASVDGKKWETISSYIPCEKAIAFKKGDKVKMTATYDLTKYRLRPDSMNHEQGAEAMALANFIWAKPN